MIHALNCSTSELQTVLNLWQSMQKQNLFPKQINLETCIQYNSHWPLLYTKICQHNRHIDYVSSCRKVRNYAYNLKTSINTACTMIKSGKWCKTLIFHICKFNKFIWYIQWSSDNKTINGTCQKWWWEVLHFSLSLTNRLNKAESVIFISLFYFGCSWGINFLPEFK